MTFNDRCVSMMFDHIFTILPSGYICKTGEIFLLELPVGLSYCTKPTCQRLSEFACWLTAVSHPAHENQLYQDLINAAVLLVGEFP